MTRRAVGSLVVTSVVLFSLLGIPGAAQSLGTLTVGLAVEPASLDRNFAESAPGFSIYPTIFEYLVKVEPKSGRLEPMLATSWRVVSPTTWEFVLRRGVRFHNGEVFDADSVKMTVETVLTTPAVVRSRIRFVERVEVVDRFTVRFITSEPFALLPQGLSQVAMYPPNYYKEKGQGYFSTNPVGTGKFRMAQWHKGNLMILEANGDYWGTDKARVRNLIFRPIVETATRLAALERGEIDIAVNVPPDEVKRLEALDLRVASTPIGQAMMVQIKPVPGTPLADKRVRQAMNYAVDKDSIVKNIMLGFTRPLDGQPVGRDAFGYSPRLKPYPFDLERAKRLLAEAGYPNGFSVKFQSSSGRYLKHREASEAVAGQLPRAGIRVEFEVIEWGTFSRSVLQTLEAGPLFYIGWNYFPVMDADFVAQHFATDSPFKLFSNTKIDELFQKQRRTFDPKERQAILQELMAVIREEAPAIFLFQSPDIFAYRPRVVGFEPTPDNAIHFDTIGLR